MPRLRSLLPLLCAALSLATTARADITIVAPTEATVGSVLAIDGEGFGAAKAKVFVVDPASGKKYAAKVTAFSDTQLTAEIKKAVPGPMDVVVQPKGKGIAPFTAKAAITVQPPTIGAILDQLGGAPLTQAEPNQEVTLVGSFYGNKKPKVKIGGKPAKVVDFQQGGVDVEGEGGNDFVIIVMPTKLANGLWTISLVTKIGADETHDISMINSTAKIGKASADLTFNGQPVNFKYTPSLANPGSGYFSMFMTTVTNPSRTFQIHVPFDVANDVPPQTLVAGGDPVFSATYIESSGSYYASYGARGVVGNLTVEINASGGGQVAGEIHALLPKAADTFPTPQVESVEVEGSFVFEP